MSKRITLTILGGLILLGFVASYLLRTTRPVGRYVGDSPAAVQISDDRRSPVVTTGAANLTVVVFTDYRCPACRKADPAFRSAVAADGNLRVVYKDWPIFGEVSQRAAEVALAAHRQGIYSQVHHALMRAPSVDQAAMRRAVENAGGNWGLLQEDLARHAPAIAGDLASNATEAFSLGLAGTPGYLIGPYLVEGALTESQFRRAFAQARAAQDDWR